MFTHLSISTISRFRRFVRTAGFACAVALAALMPIPGGGAWAAHGDGLENSTTDVSAAELAYEILALRSVMTGPLVGLVDTLAPMESEAGDVDVLLDYVLTFPDGSTMTVVMRSLAEVQEFLDMVTDKYAALTPVLKSRLGRRPLEGEHQAQIGGACTKVLPAQSQVSVHWDGDFFLMRSASMRLQGVAVEGVVMLLCEQGILPPLTGHWHDDRLYLESQAINCTIELRTG